MTQAENGSIMELPGLTNQPLEVEKRKTIACINEKMSSWRITRPQSRQFQTARLTCLNAQSMFANRQCRNPCVCAGACLGLHHLNRSGKFTSCNRHKLLKHSKRICIQLFRENIYTSHIKRKQRDWYPQRYQRRTEASGHQTICDKSHFFLVMMMSLIRLLEFHPRESSSQVPFRNFLHLYSLQ